MKIFKFIVILVLLSNIGFCQIEYSISVNPKSETHPPSEALQPGLFYFQFWNPTVNAIYNYISHDKMYNSLRQNKFESECWKWSLSFDDVLQ